MSNYRETTLAACGPRSPSTISNSTSWPSSSVLKPSAVIAEKCTNTSSPSSRSMNPNPFSALNHLTLPVIIMNDLLIQISCKVIESIPLHLLDKRDRKVFYYSIAFCYILLYSLWNKIASELLNYLKISNLLTLYLQQFLTYLNKRR